MKPCINIVNYLLTNEFINFNSNDQQSIFFEFFPSNMLVNKLKTYNTRRLKVSLCLWLVERVCVEVGEEAERSLVVWLLLLFLIGKLC